MVEHLKQEFALAMKLSGAARVSDIHAEMLVPQAKSIRPGFGGNSSDSFWQGNRSLMSNEVL
jgi:hypothetical protein